jgi:hypothetical protein
MLREIMFVDKAFLAFSARIIFIFYTDYCILIHSVE